MRRPPAQSALQSAGLFLNRYVKGNRAATNRNTTGLAINLLYRLNDPAKGEFSEVTAARREKPVDTIICKQEANANPS